MDYNNMISWDTFGWCLICEITYYIMRKQAEQYIVFDFI